MISERRQHRVMKAGELSHGVWRAAAKRKSSIWQVNQQRGMRSCAFSISINGALKMAASAARQMAAISYNQRRGGMAAAAEKWRNSKAASHRKIMAQYQRNRRRRKRHQHGAQ